MLSRPSPFTVKTAKGLLNRKRQIPAASEAKIASVDIMNVPLKDAARRK
jgi:hypothetical protein